jgi:hypothetical protein
MKLRKLFVGIIFITAFIYGYPQTGDILFRKPVEHHRVETSLSTVFQKKEVKESEDTKVCFEKEFFKETIEYMKKIDFRFVSSPPRASPML